MTTGLDTLYHFFFYSESFHLKIVTWISFVSFCLWLFCFLLFAPARPNSLT